ncbi:MAG: hypothetical protein ABW200_01735, partial [Hyphomicrobiaceae bacterium]
RARSALHIAARADVITEALARHASRWSGLGWRLGGDDDDGVLPGEADTVAPPAPAQGLLF